MNIASGSDLINKNDDSSMVYPTIPRDALIWVLEPRIECPFSAKVKKNILRLLKLL